MPRSFQSPGPCGIPESCGVILWVFIFFFSACHRPSAPELPAPIFTHEEVMSYVPKGPADCFRQISFDMNEKQVYADSVLDTFLSEQDPVKYAAFCKKIHLDAALLQALPQAGYATYRQTTVNTVYPGMKGDFFGETLRELHKQGLSGFGYIGIGWIMKYANEHPAYTEGDKVHPLICLNSPYRDRVIATTREVLNNYPVDGLRYDILDQPSTCRCDSCKKLYQELFHDTMPARWVDWQHEEKFRIESISRIVRDLYAVCKAVKPSVPVWQNWFQGEDRADISDVNYVDMSYLEFTDPFRELFLNGVFDKKGIITGKVIENPNMGWKCLALGGHCYSYFASVGKTGLPDGDTSFDRIVPPDWFEKTLAPFYARVQEVQPYLEDTHPVTNVAIVYDEKTRYHYDQYGRDEYMKLLREITLPLLGAGNPVRYISNVHLTTTSLDAYKALILPETSGLSADQLEVIRQFAAKGGAVVVVGDALSYTAGGQPLSDFALADMMGVSRRGMPETLKPVGTGVSDSAGMLRTRMLLQRGQKPEPLYTVDSPFTAVTVNGGRTISWIRRAGGSQQPGGSRQPGGGQQPGGSKQPLVHINRYGNGCVYYIASSAMPQLVACVLNDAGVRSPLRNDNVNGLAVLTRKDHENEWVLHLTDKGKYSLVIDKKYCGASAIAATFPAGMKNIRLRSTPDALLIEVNNENDYSAIVLR